MEHYLKKPDRFWTWKWTAIKKAKQLIKEENIKYVYTTCLPFTTNQIGLALKKTTNVKWVADFRDPITYAKRMHSEVFNVYKLQKQIQDNTFEYADHITVLSSAYELIFNDQYEGKYNHKITFIPTGVDDEYIPHENKEENNEIIFVGEYLKEYQGHFFKIYKKAIKDIANAPKIRIIGNIHINQTQSFPHVKKYNLERNVIFQDHMPQTDLYNLLHRARFALMIPGTTSLWWTNFAKMVDYIALKKKVIALVPQISEAKSELNKVGLGIFLGDNETENIEILKDAFSKKNTVVEADINYCNKYFASSQTKSFIKIFNSI